MLCVFTEDLTKSEDKEDVKKEVEDGKGAKKTEDPEVNSGLTHLCFKIATSF